MEVPTKISINTGISARVELSGAVGPYEEYAAMRHGGFNEIEWETLEPTVRARAVAHFRLSRAVESHEQEASIEASKSKSKPQSSPHKSR